MNMKPFRILLASMPAILMEMIVQIIGKEPDFMIVGEIAGCSDLTSAVRRYQADLLIVGESSLAAVDVTAALSSNYPTKIITITENGHCATLNELRPHRETLVDVSAARLIAAIRTAIGPGELKPSLQ